MKFKQLLIAALLITFGFQPVFSQMFHLYDFDTTSFPAMKGLFLAKTLSGADYADVVADDMVFTENGQSVVPSLTVEKTRVNYFPKASVVLILDNSNSMKDTMQKMPVERKLDWVKFAAKWFIDTIRMTPGTSYKFLTFASKIYRDSPVFSDSNKQAPKDWLDANFDIQPGSTDFKVPFLTSGGAVDVLKSMPYSIPRVIIFVTDGAPERNLSDDDQALIENTLKANKIRLYMITIVDRTSDTMRYISSFTGGKEWGRLDKANLKKAINECTGGHAQNKDIYQFVWTAPFGCNEASRQRNVFAKFTRIPFKDSTTISYTAPQTLSIARVDADKASLMFGNPAVQGSQKKRNLILTARNTDFDITAFNFSSSNQFKVNSALPVKLTKDLPKTLEIEYIETPPGNSHEVTLNFQTQPCSIPSVNLIAPCGGIPKDTADCGYVTVGLTKDFTFNSVFANSTVASITGEVKFDGPDKAEFEILQGLGAFSLPIGGSLTVKIKAKPTSTGRKLAELTFDVPVCGTTKTIVQAQATTTDVRDDQSHIGNIITLVQNYPNPCSDYTEFEYSASGNQPVSLQIYNTIGEMLLNYNNISFGQGVSKIGVDISAFSEGIYMCRLVSGSHSVQRSFVITR